MLQLSDLISDDPTTSNVDLRAIDQAGKLKHGSANNFIWVVGRAGWGVIDSLQSTHVFKLDDIQEF